MSSENVELRAGDLFASGAQTLAITVNCVGVMGKGIALEAKRRFPELARQYEELCRLRAIRPGAPAVVGDLTPPKLLLFPTKDHWRSVSKLSDIEKGLDSLAANFREWGIRSLAVPPLGCGLGGLEWAVVGPTLFRGLSRLPIPVFLYVPAGMSPEEADRTIRVDTLTTPTHVEAASVRVGAPVVAVLRVLELVQSRRPQASAIGRVLLQKLVYFAQASGIALGLRFERKSYGPFAPGLAPLVRHLINNGLLCEEPTGYRDGFRYVVGASFAEYATNFQLDLKLIEPQILKLASVFSTMSTDQAELAATTHMVARELEVADGGPPTADRIADGVLEWKRRRSSPFARERVLSCIEWERENGWIAKPN